MSRESKEEWLALRERVAKHYESEVREATISALGGGCMDRASVVEFLQQLADEVEEFGRKKKEGGDDTID